MFQAIPRENSIGVRDDRVRKQPESHELYQGIPVQLNELQF